MTNRERELEDQIESKDRELSGLEAKNVDHVRIRIEQVNKIEKLESELADHAQEIDRLKFESGECRDQLIETIKQNEAKDRELAELREQLVQSNNTGYELGKKLLSSQEQVNTMREALEKIKETDFTICREIAVAALSTIDKQTQYENTRRTLR